jgi:mRNA interferase MazF
MQKGDIVLIPFPFTDLKGNKLRPALVLFSDDLDVTVAFITSENKWLTKNDLKIEPTNTNGLKITSLIRLSKIATIDKDLILGKIGNLSLKEINSVNHKLREILNIDSQTPPERGI